MVPMSSVYMDASRLDCNLLSHHVKKLFFMQWFIECLVYLRKVLFVIKKANFTFSIEMLNQLISYSHIKTLISFSQICFFLLHFR